MGSTYRIGIAGAGGIFKESHLSAWLENQNCEIVAICDVNETRAREMAKRSGAKLVYTDYKQMLAAANLDAIDICAPNLYHSEIAIAALEAGCGLSHRSSEDGRCYVTKRQAADDHPQQPFSSECAILATVC